MAKITVLISTLIVILLGACLYFFLVSVPLDNSLKEDKTNKDKELNVKLSRERELIRNELEEKYKAQIDSYESLAVILEAEKQKTLKLQGKAE